MTDRPKSDVNIYAKVFAVLFQLPRKLDDCGEDAHAVDVNIYRVPSTTKFHNERRVKRFCGERCEKQKLYRADKASDEMKDAQPYIFIFLERNPVTAFPARYSRNIIARVARFVRSRRQVLIKTTGKSCGLAALAVIARGPPASLPRF